MEFLIERRAEKGKCSGRWHWEGRVCGVRGVDWESMDWAGGERRGVRGAGGLVKSQGPLREDPPPSLLPRALRVVNGGDDPWCSTAQRFRKCSQWSVCVCVCMCVCIYVV